MQRLFITLMCLLFAAGCSGGGGNKGFVASPSDNPGPGGSAGNGSVTFNFVKAQTAIEVPTSTVALRFQFYTGLEGTGVVVLNETRPFAAKVTFENVPTSVRSTKVTALTSEGFPIREFVASVGVVASEETVVSSASGTSTPITLDTVSASPASLSLAIGGTATPVVQLNFSNGEFVRLTEALVSEALFSSSDSSVASVDPATGEVTGLLNGTSVIRAEIVDYPGKSVDVVTQVGTGVVNPPLVTTLTVQPTAPDTFPLSLPVGTQSRPVVVTATFDTGESRVVTIADGLQFVTNNTDFTVDSSQRVVLAGTGATTGTTTITARFMGASATFRASANSAILNTITVTPNEISLPIGGFEQVLTVVGTFSDGSTVPVSAANVTLTPPSTTRYSTNPTTLTVTSAVTDPGGPATQEQMNVSVTLPGGTAQGVVGITVGAITVESLTITPSPATLKPGQVQSFTVIANLTNDTTIDVSDFAGLTIEAINPDPGTVNIVANGKQVVAVSPTTTGDATVEFTFAGFTESASVTVLREFLTSVEYHFAGNPIQNQTVNLPRGYVGIVEVYGTFNTGTVRRLNFNEYSLSLPAPTGEDKDPFNMIRLFNDSYAIPSNAARYSDGLPSDFSSGNVLSVNDLSGPAANNFDLDGNHVPQTDEAVSDDLYGGGTRVAGLVGTPHPLGGTIRGSDFGVVATRPTFRGLAADWPRGEIRNGTFVPPGTTVPAGPDGELVADSADLLVAPGSQRFFDITLDPSVTNPDDPTFFNQKISVSVSDPRSVTFASAGFVNYSGETQTPTGSVREFEVRVNFAAVTENDTSDDEEPAVGPFVLPFENFKLAEANVRAISNFGGQNEFSFNTPTSLGFMGIASNTPVDVNTLSLHVLPLAGIGVRPIATIRPERRPAPSPPPNSIYNPAIYIVHNRVFGPGFGVTLSESGLRNAVYDPGPPLPDSASQANREPADTFVYNNTRIQNAIRFIDPALFSLDPINGAGNDPLEITLGASQIFRVMVQFTGAQAPVERTLDYPPTLVVDNASPALASFGDTTTGRLAVSAISLTGGNVGAADVDTTTGYPDLASHPDVAASLAANVQGIVIALDSVGQPIMKKGAWVSTILDVLQQSGPAQSVTKVGTKAP